MNFVGSYLESHVFVLHMLTAEIFCNIFLFFMIVPSPGLGLSLSSEMKDDAQ